jgi:hypothetical protein
MFRIALGSDGVQEENTIRPLGLVHLMWLLLVFMITHCCFLASLINLVISLLLLGLLIVFLSVVARAEANYFFGFKNKLRPTLCVVIV